MSTNSFGYDIRDVSQHYVKYRPNYPEGLYDKIFQYLDEGLEGNGRRGLAVDIGCGSGLSTLMLAKHFEEVIGIDNSETQLTEALEASAGFGNVSYKLGSAERASSLVTNESVDLVTVGTALHWFDISSFYEECLKILKPGRILAVYAVKCPVYDNPEAHRLIGGICRETFKDYWTQEANNFCHGYTEPWTLLPQYFDRCMRDDSITFNQTRNLREVIGSIKTLPEYVYYKRDHPEHPDDVDLLLERLKEVFDTISTEERVVKSTSSMVLLLGRKKPEMIP